MNRRDAILGAMAFGLAPCAAWPQQPGRAYRLAWFGTRTADAKLAMEFVSRGILAPAGFVPGGNLEIDSLLTESDKNPAQAISAVLAQKKFDAVVAMVEPELIEPLRRSLGGVPLVLLVGIDAVAEGLIRDLSHPDSNTTGVTFMASETLGKRVELLKELFPSTRRIRLLTQNSDAHRIEAYVAPARQAGMSVKAFFVENKAELAKFFATPMSKDEALYVGATRWNIEHRDEIVKLALQSRARAIYPFSQFVDVGGLATYQADMREAMEQLGRITVKVLRGTPASGIPFEQVTRFQLVLNLKTARDQGIKIPQSVLARADRVVE